MNLPVESTLDLGGAPSDLVSHAFTLTIKNVTYVSECKKSDITKDMKHVRICLGFHLFSTSYHSTPCYRTRSDTLKINK